MILPAFTHLSRFNGVARGASCGPGRSSMRDCVIFIMLSQKAGIGHSARHYANAADFVEHHCVGFVFQSELILTHGQHTSHRDAP